MAGFQWVTQFAYDPLATAYGNTEYQTHYLNLAYTPAKAISFLIANRVFHLLPRNKDYGSYPADSVFDAYHVSYTQNMSEMNTAKEFYYSGTTTSAPIDPKKLEHIAGVGSSAIIAYKGYGAYFIDKLENGVWRLEVMPDAITVRDPFERPSPAREAVHIQWQEQAMQIMLQDIGNDFDIKPVNKDNNYQATAANGSFTIKPGTYLLVKKGRTDVKWTGEKMLGNISLNEFVAPPPFSKEPYVSHTPATEVSAGKAFTIKAKIINISTDAKVSLLTANRAFGPPASITMEKISPYDYSAVIPAAQVTPGIFTYRIIIQDTGKYISFPRGFAGDPYSWDNINNETWQTFVAAPNGKLSLFNATADGGRTNTYFPVFTRNGGAVFTAGEETGQLTFRASSPGIKQGQVMGFQLFIGDKIKYRLPEVSSFSKIVIRARLTSGPGKLRIALINNDASAYAATVDVTDRFKDVEIPLAMFKPDSSLLLPRPYPGFLPLWFKASSFSSLSIPKLDKLEVTAGNDLSSDQYNKPFGIEVESVTLEP